MAAPKKNLPPLDDIAKESLSHPDRRSFEMALRRREAIGSFKGRMKLTLDDAIAPLEESDLEAWGLGKTF